MATQEWAPSKAAEARSTMASPPLGPTICKPIGKPWDDNPHGMLAAVCWDMLKGKAKGLKPQNGSTGLPPMTEGCCPTGKAVTAMVGVNIKSYSSRTASRRACNRTTLARARE